MAYLSDYLKQLTMTRPFLQGPRVMIQTKPFSTNSNDKVVVPGSTIVSLDPRELSTLHPKFVKHEQGNQGPLVPTLRSQQSKARLFPRCQDNPSRHPFSNRRQGVRREFTLLPGSLSQVLMILREKGLLFTEPNQPNPERFSNYNPSKKCDYHLGEVGHSTNDCYVLKHKVQDLLDTGAFTFRASWFCQGRDDLLIVPNIRTTPPSPARMMHEEKEVIDTLGQLSGKFDYYVKYSAPSSFYVDPCDIVPDGWRGIDDPTPLVTEDPDDVMEGITALFDNFFIGAIEEGPLEGMGIGLQEGNFVTREGMRTVQSDDICAVEPDLEDTNELKDFSDLQCDLEYHERPKVLTVDQTVTVNLSDFGEPKEVKIGATLPEGETKCLIQLPYE